MDYQARQQAAREAVDKLESLTEGDPDGTHSEADEILCDLLRDLGHAAVADAWNRVKERVGFWYA